MPIYSFNTLAELTAYITNNIKANGNEDITGQRHQDVLISTAWSLFNIMSAVPPSVVNQFPAWDSGTVYEGGQEKIVVHNGKLWLFVSATNSIGTTPGTNTLVWLEFSAASLAHFRNQDTYLAFGTPDQVSAAALRALLSAPTPTLANVLASGLATGGYRMQVDRPVNEVPYSQPANGTVVIDPQRSPRQQLTVTGNITLDYSAITGSTQFSLELWNGGGVGSHTVSWASLRWTKGTNVVIPAALPTSSLYLLDVVSWNGKLHIKSVQDLMYV